MNQVVPMQKPSLIAIMASNYNMDPDKFAATIRTTCMPNTASNEDFAAFLMVAHEHNLNPVTREIYAFPKKGGGIQPIVSIDGWMNLMNSHPQFDGVEFEDIFDKAGNLSAIKCLIYRKDRTRPVVVTEYMEECKRPTEPWQKWPARMLRHKAAIQCARYAFSFSGIIDPEEAERSPDLITEKTIAPAPTMEAPGDLDEPAEIETPEEIFARAKEWFANCHTKDDLLTEWEQFADLELGSDDMLHLQSIFDEQEALINGKVITA